MIPGNRQNSGRLLKNTAPLYFNRSSSLWNLVFVMTMIVYAAGLFIDIMEPDSAVYAEVSMEMVDRQDLLSIYHKGIDWLDKPHFPFWMTAFSYKLFGVNTVAYKLPAILFTLIGALYTFLFARKYYSPLHGWISVLILITAQHIIISNQDVRAEAYLTGLLIMGLFHLTSVISPGISSARAAMHLAAGSLAMACLIMTKGLFTIIPVAAGIGFALLYQKNYKALFHWRWLLVMLLTLVFLFPSLYGYYLQFDMHPEKTVFGKNGVSGVEFFLWTSQWGRFTNTGPITGKGDPSFFIHTLLWAFLPWAFMAFFALFRKTKELIRRTSSGENYTYFGFITLFLIFSASKFQLSFYLNPLFSLLAIVTTAMILKQGPRVLKIFSVMHFVVAILLVLGMVALHYFFFGTSLPAFPTIIFVIFGSITGFQLFITSRSYLKKIFFATSIICLSVNYYLAREFYPELLTYQAESQVAHYMKAHSIPGDRIVFLGEVQSVADIILHHTTPIVHPDSATVQLLADKYVLTSPEGREKINELGLKYEVVQIFDDFHVTRITGKFINKKTRSSELQQKFLLKTSAVDFSKPGMELTLGY